MAKEIGPRSRYAKCLIKGLASSWKNNYAVIPVELKRLYETFSQGGFEKKKADSLYRDTVEGILDFIPGDVNTYRTLSKRLVNPDLVEEALEESPEPVIEVPEVTDLDWMDDESDVSMGGLFDDNTTPEKLSELHQELIAYMGRVEEAWDYLKPFFFRRSKENPSTLFVVTSVGPSGGIRTNVNAAIGPVKLPEIGEEFLFYENGVPVKYGLDGKDGRTYWGWVFKIINGTKLRFWMSRTMDGDDEAWQQRARVSIKLDPGLPRGYKVLSANHEDRKRAAAAV